jgi:nucleotide-binding universal stress UspA family protein
MTACAQDDPVARPLTIYLEKKAEELQKVGVEVNVSCVIGDIAGEILDVAEKNRIGLIAMTSRGASGTSRWSLGGVALKVVLHSNTPCGQRNATRPASRKACAASWFL